MVHLDVHEEFAEQVVALEEPMNGCSVVVVLMLRGFLRLGFDEKRARESDLVLVLHDHRQEPGELVGLLPHTGVEQGLVSLAAPPQDVVGACEAVGGIDCILDLSSGVCENVRVGVGCGSRSESGVTEGVARAPEQLDTGPIHVTSGVLDRHFEVPSGLRKICTRRSDIDVVEAEGRAELGEELESSIHLQTRRRHWIAAGLELGTIEGACPEDVAAGPVERMPIADGDPQVIFHTLAEHHPIGLVDAVC